MCSSRPTAVLDSSLLWSDMQLREQKAFFGKSTLLLKVASLKADTSRVKIANKETSSGVDDFQCLLSIYVTGQVGLWYCVIGLF
jgi:hypothetical protein